MLNIMIKVIMQVHSISKKIVISDRPYLLFTSIKIQVLKIKKKQP